MSLWNKLINAAVEANEQAHINRLHRDFVSTNTMLEELSDSLRPDALASFLENRTKVRSSIANWSRDGALKVAADFFNKARTHKDYDKKESIALALSGLWLESGIRRSHSTAENIYQTLEKLAIGLHPIFESDVSGGAIIKTAPPIDLPRSQTTTPLIGYVTQPHDQVHSDAQRERYRATSREREMAKERFDTSQNSFQVAGTAPDVAKPQKEYAGLIWMVVIAVLIYSCQAKDQSSAKARFELASTPISIPKESPTTGPLKNSATQPTSAASREAHKLPGFVAKDMQPSKVVAKGISSAGVDQQGNAKGASQISFDSLTASEKDAVEKVCAVEKKQGEAGFKLCVSQQLANLSASELHSSSNLSWFRDEWMALPIGRTDEIESICEITKTSGVVPYGRCLVQQLRLAKSG